MTSNYKGHTHRMRPQRERKKTNSKNKKKADNNAAPAKNLPLSRKSVYIDMKRGKDAQLVEEHLLKLGARVEAFLSADINYVISSFGPSKIEDVQKCSDENPNSPLNSVASPFSCVPSPSAPGSTESKKSVVSRGKALAHLACSKHKVSTVVTNAEKMGVKVISVEVANKWMERELQRLDKEGTLNAVPGDLASPKKKPKAKLKSLKGCYIKFEASNRHYKPVKLVLEKWPKVNLLAPPGLCPFVESKAKVKHGFGHQKTYGHKQHVGSQKANIEKMSKKVKKSCPSEPEERKSLTVAHSNQAHELLATPITTAGDVKRNNTFKKNVNINKQQGYCDCCETKFKSLEKHIWGEEHQTFARDKLNYEGLDKLISEVPYAKFLQDVLLSHCIQKQKETAGSLPDRVTDECQVTTQVLPPPNEKALDSTAITTAASETHEASAVVPLSLHTPQLCPAEISPSGDQLLLATDTDLASQTDNPSQMKANVTPVTVVDGEGSEVVQDQRPQAVVIRRPMPSGIFTSPRRPRQPTPNKTPRGMERSMVFRDSPIGSLQPSPCSGSPTVSVGSIQVSTPVTTTTIGASCSRKKSVSNNSFLVRAIDFTKANLPYSKQVKRTSVELVEEDTHTIETFRPDCDNAGNVISTCSQNSITTKNVVRRLSMESVAVPFDKYSTPSNSGKIEEEISSKNLEKNTKGTDYCQISDSVNCKEKSAIMPTKRHKTVTSNLEPPHFKKGASDEKITTSNVLLIGEKEDIPTNATCHLESATGFLPSSRNSCNIKNESEREHRSLRSRSVTPTKVRQDHSVLKESFLTKSENVGNVNVDDSESTDIKAGEDSPHTSRKNLKSETNTDEVCKLPGLSAEPIISVPKKGESINPLSVVSPQKRNFSTEISIKSTHFPSKFHELETNKTFEVKDDKNFVKSLTQNEARCDVAFVDAKVNDSTSFCTLKNGDSSGRGQHSKSSQNQLLSPVSVNHDDVGITKESVKEDEMLRGHKTDKYDNLSQSKCQKVKQRRASSKDKNQTGKPTKHHCADAHKTQTIKTNGPGKKTIPICENMINTTATGHGDSCKDLNASSQGDVELVDAGSIENESMMGPTTPATKRNSRFCKQFTYKGLYSNGGLGPEECNEDLSSVIVPNIAERIKSRIRAVGLSENSADEADNEEGSTSNQPKARKIVKARKRCKQKPGSTKMGDLDRILIPKSPAHSSRSKKDKKATQKNVNGCEIFLPNIADCVKRRRSCTLFNHEGQYANSGEGSDDEPTLTDSRRKCSTVQLKKKRKLAMTPPKFFTGTGKDEYSENQTKPKDNMDTLSDKTVSNYPQENSEPYEELFEEELNQGIKVQTAEFITIQSFEKFPREQAETSKQTAETYTEEFSRSTDQKTCPYNAEQQQASCASARKSKKVSDNRSPAVVIRRRKTLTSLYHIHKQRPDVDWSKSQEAQNMSEEKTTSGGQGESQDSLIPSAPVPPMNRQKDTHNPPVTHQRRSLPIDVVTKSPKIKESKPSGFHKYCSPRLKLKLKRLPSNEGYSSVLEEYHEDQDFSAFTDKNKALNRSKSRRVSQNFENVTPKKEYVSDTDSVDVLLPSPQVSLERDQRIDSDMLKETKNKISFASVQESSKPKNTHCSSKSWKVDSKSCPSQEFSCSVRAESQISGNPPEVVEKSCNDTGVKESVMLRKAGLEANFQVDTKKTHRGKGSNRKRKHSGRLPVSATSTKTKRAKLSGSWYRSNVRTMKQYIESEHDSTETFHGFNESSDKDLRMETAVDISDAEQNDCSGLLWEKNTGEKMRPTLGRSKCKRDDNLTQASEENNAEDYLALIQTFSSPGKATDSSWGDVCDSYLSTTANILSKNQSPLRHPKSPGSSSKTRGKQLHISPKKLFSDVKRSRNKVKLKGQCENSDCTESDQHNAVNLSQEQIMAGNQTPSKRISNQYQSQSPVIQVDRVISFNMMSPQKLRSTPFQGK